MGGLRYSGGFVLLREKTLIARIRRMARSSTRGHTLASNRGVFTGIGDDCAVLRLLPGQESLVTTDFTLEGIHFRRDWHPPESVGQRCLTRGLSDIAPRGGEPVAAFLSLALPRDLPQSWVGRFARSLISLAEKFGVSLAGGDTAESPNGILADRIVISGELGGSAAAVLRMSCMPKKKLSPRNYRRHFYPEPRIELGRILRKKGLASAMIDTSDGLSTDLAHLCEESGVGAELDAALIPRARVGKPPREVDLDLALHGGEDYELLFTARPGKHIPAQIAGVALTHIGHITRAPKILLRTRPNLAYELEPRGWQHFQR